MREFIIRGTISFPFEARIRAEEVPDDFDLCAHFGVEERVFGALAWADDGPLSDPEHGVTILDTDSRVIVERVEPIG